MNFIKIVYVAHCEKGETIVDAYLKGEVLDNDYARGDAELAFQTLSSNPKKYFKVFSKDYKCGVTYKNNNDTRKFIAEIYAHKNSLFRTQKNFKPSKKLSNYIDHLLSIVPKAKSKLISIDTGLSDGEEDNNVKDVDKSDSMFKFASQMIESVPLNNNKNKIGNEFTTQSLIRGTLTTIPIHDTIPEVKELAGDVVNKSRSTLNESKLLEVPEVDIDGILLSEEEKASIRVLTKIGFLSRANYYIKHKIAWLYNPVGEAVADFLSNRIGQFYSIRDGLSYRHIRICEADAKLLLLIS